MTDQAEVDLKALQIWSKLALDQSNIAIKCASDINGSCNKARANVDNAPLRKILDEMCMLSEAQINRAKLTVSFETLVARRAEELLAELDKLKTAKSE